MRFKAVPVEWCTMNSTGCDVLGVEQLESLSPGGARGCESFCGGALTSILAQEPPLTRPWWRDFCTVIAANLLPGSFVGADEIFGPVVVVRSVSAKRVPHVVSTALDSAVVVEACGTLSGP